MTGDLIPLARVIIDTHGGQYPGAVLDVSDRAVTVAYRLPGGGTAVDTVTPDHVQLDPEASADNAEIRRAWLDRDAKPEEER